jgi:hypothetical protein
MGANKFIVVIILLISMVPCKENTSMPDIFKREKEFQMRVSPGDKKNVLDSSDIVTVYKDAPYLNILIDWINNNSKGWDHRRFIPSWATPEISLISTNIKFLIYKDGVVLILKDRNGKEQEYVKKTNLSEFAFLLEK